VPLRYRPADSDLAAGRGRGGPRGVGRPGRPDRTIAIGGTDMQSHSTIRPQVAILP